MSSELKKYYKRVTSYVVSVEDMSSNEWEYIKHCVVGGNSMAAVRTAYPMLTEKQCVNKNASLSQNKVIQEQLEVFREKLEVNRKQALTDIYHTISELELSRSYMLRRLTELMNKAEENNDYNAALKAWDLISKVQGHYSPIKTEHKTEVQINFGGWNPEQENQRLNSNNELIIDLGKIPEDDSEEEE